MDHARRILPINDEVVLEWGRLAAEAAVHRKVVVTRNVSDFRDLGVQVPDPWNLG